MSQASTISESVDEIIADSLGVEQSNFDDETRLDAEPLALESVDILDIAEALHSELDVHASANDIEALETVDDLKQLVESRVDEA